MEMLNEGMPLGAKIGIAIFVLGTLLAAGGYITAMVSIRVQHDRNMEIIRSR